MNQISAAPSYPVAPSSGLIALRKKKWLLIAILVSGPLAGIGGLVLGIAFLTEPEYRRYGWLLIGWTIVWNIFAFFLMQWLTQSGYVPRFTPVYR